MLLYTLAGYAKMGCIIELVKKMLKGGVTPEPEV